MTNVSQKFLGSLAVLVPFTRNYPQSLHASEISRLLRLPQKTVARKLDHLQKLRILEYKRTGKNKYYFFNLNLLSSYAVLNMVENYKEVNFLLRHPQLALLLNELASKYAVILFGSYAKGRPNEGSDVDLVIFGRKSAKIKSIIKKYPFDVNAHYVTYHLFEKRLKEGQSLAREIVKDHLFFGEKEKSIRILIDYYKK